MLTASRTSHRDPPEANRSAYFNNPKMMKDDARRIAHVIARIPELLEIEKRAKGEIPQT